MIMTRVATVLLLSLLSFTPACAQSLSWAPVGPGGGGWVRSLAVDPKDPAVVFAGIDIGGIFRTVDGGATWVQVSKGLRNFQIEKILVDPSDSRVVFAATLGGVYKSTDQGASWQLLTNGMPAKSTTSYSAPLRTVAIDPGNASVVYAAGRVGSVARVFKSTDKGAHWQQIGGGTLPARAAVNDLAIDPKNSKIVYLATALGVYKSSDGGASWGEASSGLPQAVVLKIAIDPIETSALYVTVKPAPGRTPGKAFKSTDGGEQWSQIKTLPSVVGVSENRSSYFNSVVVDPHNHQTVFVGDQGWVSGGVYKSTDGGKTWSVSHMARSYYFGGAKSVNAIAVARDSRHVYYGTPYYVAKSADNGATWQSVMTEEVPPGSGRCIGRGLNSSVVEKIAFDPTNDEIVYAGFLDIGLWRSTDDGRSWSSTIANNPCCLDIRAIVPDPTVPGLVYAGTSGTNSLGRGPGSVIVSSDYGATWRPIAIPEAPTDRFAVSAMTIDTSSPLSKRTLYVALFGGGVYRTGDGGRTWLAQNDGLPNNPRVASLTYDGATSEVFAGLACSGSDQANSGIYRLSANTTHWQQVDRGTPPYGRIACVSSVALDPNDPRRLYASTRNFNGSLHAQTGGVWSSKDSGEHWSLLRSVSADAANGVYAKTVVVDERSRVYALMEHNPYSDLYTPPDVATGLYVSEDFGVSWHAENQGLSLPNVNALALSSSGKYYAGTSGTGLYRAVLNARPR